MEGEEQDTYFGATEETTPAPATEAGTDDQPAVLEVNHNDKGGETKINMDPVLPNSEKSNLGYGSVKNGHSSQTKVHPSFARSSSIDGSVVSFHDITYTVKTKENRKKVTKTILTDVNGLFKPGMNAILGPTGSGKTSLLDVLAARKDPDGLSGQVLIDGATQPKNFKCISGYVVQDDVVMGTLTIRENLQFSAALRLPKTVGKKERDDRVDDILAELGLSHVGDSKVGTEFIRGVSGGERKRTNVGMELITKPSVLFLDEPTTGLDASTANAVMHLLASLSKRGRTIIFSIHQPRYSIFRLFDKMHLLGRGKTIYHGPAQEALEYFSSIGFECEEHNNPPDFFLDVIIGQSEDRKELEDGQGDVEQGQAVLDDGVKSNINLAECYGESQYYRTMKDATEGIYNEYRNQEETSIVSIDYPTSFFSQLYHVSHRAVLNILRNPFLTIIQNMTVILFSVVIGGIYFQLDTSIASGYQNRIGAFFFLIMQMVFGNLSAVELFIRERVIFIHESASGFYRVSVYFVAKVFCDLLPLRVIPTVLYVVITYWMIGLQPDVAKFFIYFLTLLLVTFVSSALAFAISSSVSIAGIATLLIAMCYVLMMVFGGLLVNISSLPVWLQWLQYLSIFRFGLNSLLINEMVGMEFCETVGNVTLRCIPGTDYLDQQGIDYSDWGLWQNEMALGIMTLGLLAIAYIQLRRLPKVK
ncbi:broad substrate specificity ATP-binding cassette transporter ABCG2-like isoform X1 [Lytechinus variegatus]|uniref:broad substrate specificity ATP-binding cassette transporter ABCG2-like isoform X1 n=1 Tax=Lytechinus variegatus TaxID=7654 RepID=UPI001BB162A5|nr:broad substrate specificity ATP-binding cassette transporter ABCG2-like isoform X1 [Lytechinus variegatus]